MFGAQMFRDGGGMGRLVETVDVEADGKRFHRRGALCLHQRRDGRGIDPAGQERPQRHVGNHAPFDGIADQAVGFVDGVGVGKIAGGGLAVVGDPAQVPIAFDACRLARLFKQETARLQLRNTFIYGGGGGHVVVAHVSGQRRRVDLRFEAGMGVEGFELRREQK